LENTHSNLGIYRRPLLKLIIGLCLIAIAVGVADLVTGPEAPFWSETVGLAALTLFMLAALIMRQTEVFQVPMSPEPTVVLSDDEVLRLKNSLNKVLHEKKLHLNPQLRLKDLAEEMGLKSYRLTALLRQGLNTTFYDHINQLRIEHAKQLLQERNQKMNILGIATESGFNSKSAFNELFKKYNHATPSQFRKNVLQG
jgi:AraC-like DNA-binding protein